VSHSTAAGRNIHEFQGAPFQVIYYKTASLAAAMLQG
jgi:hypothetical protein